MSESECVAEIARLHAFVLQLAEHLAAASAVLTKLAESKNRRAIEGQPSTGPKRDDDEMN